MYYTYNKVRHFLQRKTPWFYKEILQPIHDGLTTFPPSANTTSVSKQKKQAPHPAAKPRVDISKLNGFVEGWEWKTSGALKRFEFALMDLGFTQLYTSTQTSEEFFGTGVADQWLEVTSPEIKGGVARLHIYPDAQYIEIDNREVRTGAELYNALTK